MARTIDHISGGRVVLGYGAGWADRDYEEYGFDFGTARSRAAAMEAGVLRIKARLAKLNPSPQGTLPLMIGGEGERVTLRVTAEHADMWNGFGPVATFAHKARVLDEWCEKVGRDPSAIQRSVLLDGPHEVDDVDQFVAAGAQEIIVPAQVPFDLADLKAVLAKASRSG
jgi:alkanesulfonate monooxygenase SsuD/methylene tetrahydromethanopterin reductase-like flavin-dependent oxidoreductase (luciferase family)